MPRIEHDILPTPADSHTRELTLFLAQLDDQSRRLETDTRGCTRAALEWQPAAGMNTIGMLLAHLAIVEVHWMQLGPLGRASSDPLPVLGIGLDGDGMPVPPRGKHPAGLRGRPLSFYYVLLARARAHTRQVAGPLTDADLERQVTRTRRTGDLQVFNLRWVFYHVLEHFAGHYGQILLLRHQFRARRRARKRVG